MLALGLGLPSENLLRVQSDILGSCGYYSAMILEAICLKAIFGKQRGPKCQNAKAEFKHINTHVVIEK